MKNIQLFEQFLNEKISKSDLKKIESYLNKQDEDTLFAFAEDAYGESDDDELADEWNDVKNDLSIDELKDYIIDHIKRFELDFEEFKDAMGIYESNFLNESRETKSIQKEYAVMLTGGSIGDKPRPKDARGYTGLSIGDEKVYTLDKAKEKAKRMNKSLTPGEKKYYGLKYVIVPVANGKFE